MAGMMMRSGLRSSHQMLVMGQRSLLRPSAASAVPAVCVQAVNTIFNSAYLSLDGFKDAQSKAVSQFGPMREKFFERMQQNVEATEEEENRNQDRMIFTEDLKNMVYLIDNEDEHLKILTAMIHKYSGQNSEQRFGSFIFGPVVMRLLYLYNRVDLALSLFNDPACGNFFSQLTTQVLLYDMLFKSERYQQVLDLFTTYVENHDAGIRYPRDLLCLAAAAAYRIGTEESYRLIKKWATDARTEGSFLSSRTIALLAASSVKFGEPEVGYEILSAARILSAVARNCKILTLCHLKRPDDALLLIRAYLSTDRRPSFAAEGSGPTGEFATDVLDILKQAVAESGQQELVNELEQVNRALAAGNHISSRSLDDQLMEDIKLSARAVEVRAQKFQGLRQLRDESQREGSGGVREDYGRSDRRPRFRGGYGNDQYDDQYQSRGYDRGGDRGYNRTKNFNNRNDDRRGYGRRDDRRVTRDDQYDGLRYRDEE